VTDHQPPLPGRRRATRTSSTHTNQTPTEEEAALTAPLLDAEGGTGAVDGRGLVPPAAAATSQRARGVPLRQPAPAHQRVYDAAQSAGSGSWVYTMARSVRLGLHALSPQSLAATAGLGGPDEDGSGSEVSGSYASTGMLASSLDYAGRTPDGLRVGSSGLAAHQGLLPQTVGSPIGLEGGSSSSGFRVVFAAGAGPGAGEAGGSSGHSSSGRPPVAPAMGALSSSLRGSSSSSGGAGSGGGAGAGASPLPPGSTGGSNGAAAAAAAARPGAGPGVLPPLPPSGSGTGLPRSGSGSHLVSGRTSRTTQQQ
jgi:hypothetical protein